MRCETKFLQVHEKGERRHTWVMEMRDEFARYLPCQQAAEASKASVNLIIPHGNACKREGDCIRETESTCRDGNRWGWILKLWYAFFFFPHGYTFFSEGECLMKFYFSCSILLCCGYFFFSCVCYGMLDDFRVFFFCLCTQT